MFHYIAYRNGVNILEGTLGDMVSLTQANRYTLRNYILANKEINGYLIKCEERESAEDGDEKYNCIIKCLEKFGNTILIKNELKYLDKLKQEFNLQITHFPKKDVSYEHEMCGGSVEDWVITDLDYCKGVRHDI